MPPVPRSRFDALGDPQSHHGRGASPVTAIRPRDAAIVGSRPIISMNSLPHLDGLEHASLHDPACIGDHLIHSSEHADIVRNNQGEDNENLRCDEHALASAAVIVLEASPRTTPVTASCCQPFCTTNRRRNACFVYR